MTIEIVVGLPHLNNGPILARAKAMQQPMLISANCLSKWRDRGGWRNWEGWHLTRLANATGLRSLDLDSAGYVLTSLYGGFPWSIASYMALAASYPFRRVAAADYCCEHQIAGDRQEVLDRIARTVATNKECRARASDLGIIDRLMPVLQGRTPEDYERCADALHGALLPGSVIGIGSMCRREIHGPEGLIAVVRHLDTVLPTSVSLHLFGVKGTALPWLLPFEARIASIDSQAWGSAARRDAHRLGQAKTDSFAADHMERWTSAQLDRLQEQPCHAVIFAPVTQQPLPCDPWERAIERARDEIRALIETADLAHDEITTGWIEAWAADIFQQSAHA